MSGFGAWWHWVIILILFVLLFGAKKLPDAARGVGRSLRILKAEVGAMSDDKKEPTPSAEAPPVATVPAPVPSPAPAVVLAPSAIPAVNLAPSAVEPIQPVQSIHPAQITVNGRPVDQN